MSGKLRKNIGFSLLPVAFLFLFEPSFALLDPLPDFIGYVIICCALINLADINPVIMDAFKGFRRAALLSIIRLASFIVLTFAFEGQEQTVTELLLVFIFALFDSIILISAYKNLFRGFIELGTYHDGKVVCYSKKNGGFNNSEKLYILSVAFVVIKNVLWVLPEFSTLAGNETYEFIGVLRLFALVIIVPVSLLWAVKILAYCIRVKKDQDFIYSLEQIYKQKADASASFFTMRLSTIGITALIVGVVLFIDVLLDNVNVTPDSLAYIALLIGAVILQRYSKKSKFAIVFAGLGVITGTLCDASRLYFYSKYQPTDVIKNIGAYNTYHFMLIANAADAVISLVTLIFALLIIWDVHAINTDYSDEIGVVEQKRMKRKFIIGAVISLAVGVLSSLGTLFHVYAMPNIEKADVFAMSNVLRIVLSCAFAFAFWYFASSVKSLVKQHCKSCLY